MMAQMAARAMRKAQCPGTIEVMTRIPPKMTTWTPMRATHPAVLGRQTFSSEDFSVSAGVLRASV